MHRRLDAQDPLSDYASDAALFGSLAGRSDFITLLRDTVAEVQAGLLAGSHYVPGN